MTPERFLDMTFRQVVGLMKVVDKSNLVEFYNQILSYRSAYNKELPSLNEFLNVAFNGKDASSFDEKVDKDLDRYALEKLKEQQKEYGKRITDKN